MYFFMNKNGFFIKKKLLFKNNSVKNLYNNVINKYLF